MSAFTFELTGTDTLLRALSKLEDKVAKRVEERLETFVKDVNSIQVARAPVDLGQLRAGNDFRKEGKLQWTLFNTRLYAPFIEFGTGGLVEVPKGLEDYAIQFKGKGIREVNLPARPFFFEPFLEKRKALIEQIKKDLTA